MTALENGRATDLDFVRTAPDTLAGRYLRRFWHPVARSEDLARGKAIPLRIMSEDLTLYRGEGGTAYAVDARCAHRRSQLSVGWVEGECIRCFYHGWRYEADGRCVEQPIEAQPFAEKVRIRSYPTREYLGLVFVYFGTDAPPELPRYPEFEGDGILDVETFVRPCNYFNDLDNACDPLHVTFVHQGSRIDINRFIDVGNIAADESTWGVTISIKRTIEGGGTRLNLFGMPNIALLRLPPTEDGETAWREFVSWRVPVDDQHYVSFNINFVHASGDAARRYREKQAARAAFLPSTSLIEPIMSGQATIDQYRGQVADIVRLQDDVVLVAQGTVPDREHEHLGRSDKGVILLRQIWRRELDALRRDQPLKNWSRGPDLVATNGLTTA